MSYPGLQVSTRFSVEELKRAAKAVSEGRMRIRLLVIRYLLQDHTTAQAAQAHSRAGADAGGNLGLQPALIQLQSTRAAAEGFVK